ncbi:MAG: SPOR domain-containing protein [Arenimonas sp.]
MAARRGKSQAKRNGGSGRPAWVWLVMGVALGVLVFGAWQVRGRWNAKDGFLPTPDPNAHAPVATSEAPIVPDAPARPKTDFTFWKILPEKEVVIPDAELAEQADAEARRAAAAQRTPPPGTPPAAPTPGTPSIDPVVAPPPPSGNYVLQAGAFRGEDEAEALKASIALTGEVARVETAQINGTTVYRVRMGPYASAGTLAAAKQALSSHGIDGAQAIRVK